MGRYCGVPVGVQCVRLDTDHFEWSDHSILNRLFVIGMV